ncbi:hemin uptake protein HemP [Nitrosomonas sp. JL21]|uniref:hemin uptake protein HemP n=1 Tax=Nitrosomonas sp. JL21 TaxID=153949 RepID=UPI0031F40DE2
MRTILITISLYKIMDTLTISPTVVRNLYESERKKFETSIDSNTLFKDTDVVFIMHKGEQYSLRRTRNGKLILNK